MRPIWFMPVLALTGALASAAAPFEARVMGQRVNVRAKAELNAEVVGQLQDTDVVQVKSVTGEWAEIVPPDVMDLWVNKDLVAGNRVTVDKANVRAGPGINYTVVGVLRRDEAVAAKGTFGEWLRIAPPEGTSLWVSKDLLVLPDAATDAPATNTSQVPVEVVTELPVTAASARANSAAILPPSGLTLLPVDHQGEVASFTGLLKPAGFLLGAPAAYRLVRANGRSYETVCHLRGNRDQLRGLLERELTVTGPAFWTERAKEPVVVVEQIQLLKPQSAP